jgi:GcrA cell cycle regulator
MIENIWTDERVARLRVLMDEAELSCSLVAQELGGGLTRNAVIGKCHRLGIPITANAPRGGDARVKKKAKRLAAAKAAAVTVTKNLPPPPPSVVAAISVLLPEEPRPDGTVTIMGLTNETCRWPLLEHPPQLYCGKREADVSGGIPYCEEHSMQATALSAPRKVAFFNKGAT